MVNADQIFMAITNISFEQPRWNVKPGMIVSSMRSSFKPFQLFDLLLTTTNCAIKRAKNRKENNDFKVVLRVSWISFNENKQRLYLYSYILLLLLRKSCQYNSKSIIEYYTTETNETSSCYELADLLYRSDIMNIFNVQNGNNDYFPCHTVMPNPGVGSSV